MANEIEITIKAKLDPDLSRVVKVRTRHEKIGSFEWIPKGTLCYKVGYRKDGKLKSGYMTVEDYQKLTGDQQ
jgi:hypothetical protein